MGEGGRGFLLHWGGAKTKGLFSVLARRCRPLADMSPARVGFNAPSSKNSRLIFAQQPRPNGKRNPLHHVLRTAGVGGGKGSGFGVQEKRSECRGQGKPTAGRASALNERSYRTAEQPHGRARTDMDGRRVRRGGVGRWGEKGRRERPQGWAKVFPETWNLKPGTEGNSVCARRAQPQFFLEPETEVVFLFSLWGVGERVWWGDGDSSCTDEDCAAGWL